MSEFKKNNRGREGLSDEEVEREIARLLVDEDVKLAKYEERLRCRRRQYLYVLRGYKNKGSALNAAGITRELLDAMYNTNENEVE